MLQATDDTVAGQVIVHSVVDWVHFLQYFADALFSKLLYQYFLLSAHSAPSGQESWDNSWSHMWTEEVWCRRSGWHSSQHTLNNFAKKRWYHMCHSVRRSKEKKITKTMLHGEVERISWGSLLVHMRELKMYWMRSWATRSSCSHCWKSVCRQGLSASLPLNRFVVHWGTFFLVMFFHVLFFYFHIRFRGLSIIFSVHGYFVNMVAWYLSRYRYVRA